MKQHSLITSTRRSRSARIAAALLIGTTAVVGGSVIAAPLPHAAGMSADAARPSGPTRVTSPIPSGAEFLRHTRGCGDTLVDPSGAWTLWPCVMRDWAC